ILVFGTLCCLYQATFVGSWLLKGLWVLPIGLFVYALVLTQSRGGLLGLLAAGSALVGTKYGWRRAIPLLAICVPAAVFAIGGRPSNINISYGDTRSGRVLLWSAGFTELFRHPLLVVFGIGAGEYSEVVGADAHNSFVHAYVDLGLIGGTFFLGAFVLSIWLLIRVRQGNKLQAPGQLLRA